MKKIVVVLLVLALGAGAWYWYKITSPGGTEEEITPTAQVVVAPLQRKAISAFVTAYGLVQPSPSGSRAISLAYDCVVQRVETGIGARVRRGDVLLRVVPSPDARLELDSARSVEALAKKGLAATRERYDLKLATSQDLLTAEQALQDAKIRLASYETRGEAGDGLIVAPVTGIVTKLDAQPGMLLTAGTPLATVGDTNDLEADLMIEAGDAAEVKPGQTVTLESASRPAAAPVSSRVRLVGAMVDLTTGSTDVRVPLPPTAGWLPGEHVRAQIEVRTDTGFVVPRDAVLPEGGEEVLYTVKDQKAVKHEVEVGITNAAWTEIRSKELAVGDPVVVVGNYELDDGMAVQAQSNGAEGGQAGPAAEASP